MGSLGAEAAATTGGSLFGRGVWQGDHHSSPLGMAVPWRSLGGPGGAGGRGWAGEGLRWLSGTPQHAPRGCLAVRGLLYKVLPPTTWHPHGVSGRTNILADSSRREEFGSGLRPCSRHRVKRVGAHWQLAVGCCCCLLQEADLTGARKTAAEAWGGLLGQLGCMPWHKKWGPKNCQQGWGSDAMTWIAHGGKCPKQANRASCTPPTPPVPSPPLAAGPHTPTHTMASSSRQPALTGEPLAQPCPPCPPCPPCLHTFSLGHHHLGGSCPGPLAHRPSTGQGAGQGPDCWHVVLGPPPTPHDLSGKNTTTGFLWFRVGKGGG